MEATAAATCPWARRSSSKPGRRLASVAARFSVGALGGGELAAESMQLADLVERRADGGMPRFAQVAERVLRGLGGIRPRSVRLQHLRPMHEALAPEGHEVWLLLAPVRQDLGPLRGPTQVEGVDARRDDPAVDDPRRDR